MMVWKDWGVGVSSSNIWLQPLYLQDEQKVKVGKYMNGLSQS